MAALSATKEKRIHNLYKTKKRGAVRYPFHDLRPSHCPINLNEQHRSPRFAVYIRPIHISAQLWLTSERLAYTTPMSIYVACS